jgi:[acyl-carrier-protein] S-malonyltransferase
MSKAAFLFSGQGAQYAGMGVNLYHYPSGKETFQEAYDVLGMDITHICCDADDSELADTEITQPAIVTCDIAAFRILGKDLQTSLPAVPSAVAGLSVGEYSALVASEAITFADALRLVRERGRLMAEAAAANPGMMVAILGLDGTVVESLCQEAGSLGIVQPANYNCPSQFVISGEEKAVQQAVELAQKAGAKKCVTLKVSGAFHSPLMKPAELGLRKALSNIKLSKPKIPFIANVTGDYVEEPEKIREMLALQLSSPIQWEASMRRMVDDGITTFVEVGPGKVLAGLMRRIYREAKISSTDNMIKESMDL